MMSIPMSNPFKYKVTCKCSKIVGNMYSAYRSNAYEHIESNTLSLSGPAVPS